MSLVNMRPERKWDSQYDLMVDAVMGDYIVGLMDPDLGKRVTVRVPIAAWGHRRPPTDGDIVMHARALLAARKRNALLRPGRHDHFKGFRA